MIEHLKRVHAMELPGLFAGMHADRKRVFVDMLKWDIPHDGIFEKDQYDTDQADYLILQDRQAGDHQGSVRLLPTTGAHMLADVFPFLCEGKVPRGPRIREITRLVVSPSVGRSERMTTRNMLGRAMIEFGLMSGRRTLHRGLRDRFPQPAARGGLADRSAGNASNGRRVADWRSADPRRGREHFQDE